MPTEHFILILIMPLRGEACFANKALFLAANFGRTAPPLPAVHCPFTGTRYISMRNSEG